MSKLLDNVVRELSRLPSVGRRTALRLAMHILRSCEDDVASLIQAIGDFRTGIRYCARCNNLSDNEFCDICSDRSRDRSQICVVEQVGDVMSIEKTGQFRGLYHVLGGVISPMAGIAPSDLKIDLLLSNIAGSGGNGTGVGGGDVPVREVILAISTTVEGETTLFYIMNRLRQFPDLRITTIARGIGFGDEIEYADELTIAHAIANRRPVER
jgi:recombination protein RecR